MSDDMNQDREVRLLRRLIDELREEPTPPVDWQRVEQQLQQRLDEDAAAAPWARRRKLARVVAWSAIAAAVGFLIFTQPWSSAPDGTVSQPTPAKASSTVDLNHLPTIMDGVASAYSVRAVEPGAVVQSGDEPVRFTLAGVASWTLDPQTRIVIRTVSVPHVLVLERGTVHAEVVPRQGSQLRESFAIETGGTRVAVRGTVFSVSRQDDRVSVSVMRGSVMVGPIGTEDSAEGQLLVGPVRAAFSLYGERIAARPSSQAVALNDEPTAEGDSPESRPGRSPAASTEAEPTAPETSPAEPDERADVADPEASKPAQPQPLTVAQARSLMTACLSAGSGESSGADEHVTVTLSTLVTLQLDGDGKVSLVRFTPPLPPELQNRCAAQLFGRTITAPPGSPVSFRVVVSSAPP